ncbi:pantoate--beta-alanine ligase [Flagellimonas sp. DF-77]|uniref:pantoate--beta-alanine ligase n=1 Tax=Flagellimonas algarum TaxID=3230298 RepID=UPI00339A151B
MRVFNDKNELRSLLDRERSKNRTIGLVPTMGALHAGHLSLVERAFSANDVTVVTIFINPTQFDNPDDLEKYPQSMDNDLRLLAQVSDQILVYAPTKEGVYDGEIISKTYNFNGLEKAMEGAFRTGHFDGVATIVEILLNIVEPTRAYFGEKDFQQLQIIRKLVEQKKLPYTIIGCPIERETNGLARSSRNERLSEATRERAGRIYSILQTAKVKFGTESALDIKGWVADEFQHDPIFELEYFEIADVTTLTPMIKKQKNRTYRAFIAVYAENVRLIDNIALNQAD